jgi:hypothetical protein
MAGDKADIKSSITVLAQRYPDALSAVDPTLINKAFSELPNDKPDDRCDLTGVVFDAHCRYFGHIEPSASWQRLALALFKQGETDRALEVASRIDDVEKLISMRADLRYAPLSVNGLPPILMLEMPLIV